MAETTNFASQKNYKLTRRELRSRSDKKTGSLGEETEFCYETVALKGDGDEYIHEGMAAADVTNKIRELSGEIILGYIWWSLFHGIAAMIWFYPLNELGISGYEICIVSIFSPIFTSSFALLKFSTTFSGLFCWRVLSLIGILSFQAPTTLIRLFMLAFGCGTGMLWFCGMIWSKDAKQRVLSFWGLILGYFLMLILRVPYVSINPIWSDVTSNLVIFIIGVIAMLDRVSTCSSKSIFQPGPQSKSSPEPEDSRVSGPGWFLVALGFGALMFLTHDVFGEASLVCRWAVSGYPHTGPKPNPWGAAVIVALAVGVLLSPYQWTSKWFWWLIGSAGAAMLYFAPRYWSLAGGLILGVYTMSIWPAMIDRLFCRPVARTLTLANLIYIVLTLGSVWTVAFNFVPGGVYTRERTHVLLGIAMTFIGLALLTKKTPDENEIYDKFSDDGKHPSTLLRNKKTPGSKFSNVAFLKENGDRMWFFRTCVTPILVCLVVVGVILMGIRYHRLDYPPPEKDDPNLFSTLLWNLHFAYDNYGWPSFEVAAQMINDTGADIVGLMESDCSKPYLGNHDLAMWFEERLGMYSDFGPSTKDHTWGATLLSKYPIVKSLHHLLPSPEGEVAPALSATINITGNLVDVVVAHMGNDRDNLDRELQARELARIVNESSNPVVFLGYVTSEPGSRDYKELTEKGRTKDIDETDPYRWCLYIMYRGLVRLGYARISHGGLSDTEVQLGKFRIPPLGADYQDNDILTKNPDDVPDNIRFPERFGSYFEGHYEPWEHRYHMSTPKYFLAGN